MHANVQMCANGHIAFSQQDNRFDILAPHGTPALDSWKLASTKEDHEITGCNETDLRGFPLAMVFCEILFNSITT